MKHLRSLFALSLLLLFWIYPAKAEVPSGYLSLPTDQFSGPTLNNTDRSLVVLIHGWNPDNYTNQFVAEDWPLLVNALSARLNDSGTKLLLYHWETDASTGNIVPGGFLNASVAATNAFLNGTRLAKLLDVTAPELREVTFIAHSAGSWAAYGAIDQLLRLNPYVIVNLVLLDPFVPGVDPSFTILTTDEMSKLATHASANRIYRLENYYEVGLTDTALAAPNGSSNATSQIFSWRIRDIFHQVSYTPNQLLHQGEYYGIEPADPTGHGGPIRFYADTVIATTSGATVPDGLARAPWDFTSVGFYRGLIHERFLLPAITAQPQAPAQPVQPGQSVTLSISANRTDSFQWFKNGEPYSETSSTLAFNSVSVGDAGEYVVRLTNTHGQVFSEKAVLQVAAVATGHVSISSLSLPSSVVLGQNFTVNFNLQEVQGAAKTFEQIAVAVLRSDDTHVFDMAVYNNVTIPASGQWSQSVTNYLYTTNPPGTYKVVVRGRLPGGDWFNFDTTGSGQNFISFSAVQQNAPTTGWVSVSQISVAPNPVVLGQNFTVNFSLRESQGVSKTFEKIAVAILRADGSLVFDAAMYDNVTVPAGGTWSRTATNYLYTSNPAATYKVVIRGKLPNDNWFDFDGANRVSFYAAAASSIPNKITVLSPNGGEVWEPGATKLITWATSGSMGSDVKVELYKGGTREFTIDNSDDNGQKNWSIPSDLDLGSNYRIKVTSNADSSIYDYSDANFIIDSSITVTSPNGGELWEPGTRQAITWTRSGTTGKEVKIQLYKGGVLLANLCDDILDDNGIRYVDILADSSTGLITVKPTNCNGYSGLQLGTDYKIKITSTRNNDVFDSSDAPFSIGDRIPPAISTVSINNGAAYTTSNGVSVAVAAADNLVSLPLEMLFGGVNLLQMRFSNDNCTNWNTWEPYAATKAWQLTPGDGPRTVCVQVKDAFGNMSVVRTANIILDPTPPVVTSVSINEGAHYTGNPQVTLSLTAIDNSGSATEMRFRNDCTSWVDVQMDNLPSPTPLLLPTYTGESLMPTWSNWELYASTKAWMLAGVDGLNEVCVQVRDVAGNISAPQTASILLDTQPPTVFISMYSKNMIIPPTGSTLTVNGWANDEGSGIKSVEVSTDGGQTWQSVKLTDAFTFPGYSGLPNSYKWSYEWPISTAGTHTIRARATDALGHVGEMSPFGGLSSYTVTAEVRQPTSVSVSGRQLLVNGTPFIMKGVYYSPVPIGDWHGTYPFPWTWNPHGEDYYQSRFADLHTRDLSRLRQMGANAMRVVRWDHDSYSVVYLDLLDKAYNNGTNPIYVIPRYYLIPGDIDPGSPSNQRENIKSWFVDMVATYKNHPAILMWEIACYPSMGNPEHLFSLINEMAQLAHAEEGSIHHPVSVAPLGVKPLDIISTYNASVLNIDVWGAYIYGGPTFGTLFTDYRQISDKPLSIVGFGIDAFDQTKGTEYEYSGRPYQAEYAASLWNEIVDNSDVCIGGTVREYSDQWWAGDMISPDCPDSGSEYHSNCGYATSAHPDSFSNAEWWGIMRTKDNGDAPDIMEPRTAYYTLRQLWTGTTQKTLTVNTQSGTGAGTVKSSPVAGINCPSDCAEAYDAGTTVTLSAVHDDGSYFAGWSGGGCTGTGPCNVTMNDNTRVAAVFNDGANYRVSGGAYNYSETTTYRATFSMDVTGPGILGGWLKYYYSRTRMNFVSTGIAAVSVSGGTATITGTGTINNVNGYTFTATMTDGAPDGFGIVIRKPDGSIYYSTAPKAVSSGDLVISQ